MRVRLLALLIPVAASAQVEYRGKLDLELVPPPVVHQVSNFRLASEEHRRLLSGDVRSAGVVFVGDVRGQLAFVVERDGANTVLYVDLNGDGQITADEKHSLAPSADRLHAGIATVLLPLPGPVYHHYPVRVYVYKPQEPASRIVGESPRSFVRGAVDIKGRPTLVEYEFDRAKNSAFPDYGLQGIDSDGDGRIDTRPQSPEYTFAKDERLVFRAGNEYVSTKTLDLVKGEVVLQALGSAEYDRIELKAGASFPDFTFIDFGGRTYKLSDYSGKHVLLDFWATWCGPCVNDLPHIRDAYGQLGGHAFEVIGMNVDDDPGTARKMLDEKHIHWPQATFDSIRELVERRVRVAAYPTYVLLDPERRIVSSDSEALRGDKLLPTLQRFLNPAARGRDR